MKATGIVRRIDDLGRVVVPKEIRRTLRIREGENIPLSENSASLQGNMPKAFHRLQATWYALPTGITLLPLQAAGRKILMESR